MFIAVKESTCGSDSIWDLFQLQLDSLKIWAIKISGNFALFRNQDKGILFKETIALWHVLSVEKQIQHTEKETHI